MRTALSGIHTDVSKKGNEYNKKTMPMNEDCP